jgi:hypothetical protein
LLNIVKQLLISEILSGRLNRWWHFSTGSRFNGLAGMGVKGLRWSAGRGIKENLTVNLHLFFGKVIMP